MAPSDLPSDPFAAHEVVLQRAQQEQERRTQDRRKPLPEQTQAEVSFLRRVGLERIAAEVLDVSSSGMRLAAFADHPIAAGDRCTIRLLGEATNPARWATVRWIKPHPMIQVFGVQFDGDTNLTV